MDESAVIECAMDEGRREKGRRRRASAAYVVPGVGRDPLVSRDAGTPLSLKKRSQHRNVRWDMRTGHHRD